MDTNTPPLLQWTAPVQPVVQRGPRWYLIGGSVVIAVTAYGILANSWPLAVVSVLSGAMYFILRDHSPRQTVSAFYESGVLHDGQFYRWDEFRGFWILQTPTHTELHLTHLDTRKHDLVLQMNDIPVQAMKLASGAFLTELTDRKESLIDIFSRLAKL